MENKKSDKLYEIGMVGLGVMGRNLLLNIADHGFSVAGYDTDKDSFTYMAWRMHNPFCNT